MLVSSVFKTPYGSFEVVHDEHFIFNAHFSAKPITKYPNALARLIESELAIYFQDCTYQFQLDLKPHGTSYQQKVWDALLAIPAGRTLTYGELATQLQSSPRAIGQACKKNPITVFVPCHRIVGKENLGGYMGDLNSISYKEYLLEHEGVAL